jgi:hypothetical protein
MLAVTDLNLSKIGASDNGTDGGAAAATPTTGDEQGARDPFKMST